VRGVASKRPGRSLPAAPAGKGGNGPEPPLPALRITGHVRSRPHRDGDLESSIMTTTAERIPRISSGSRYACAVTDDTTIATRPAAVSAS
jgi:hypothetical protein